MFRLELAVSVAVEERVDEEDVAALALLELSDGKPCLAFFVASSSAFFCAAFHDLN